MFMSHHQSAGQSNNIEWTQIIFTIWIWNMNILKWDACTVLVPSVREGH
jgi:hypothetical protein